MYRKLFCALFAVFLLLSALAACQSAAPGNDANTGSVSAQEQTTDYHPAQPFAGTYTEKETGFGSVEVVPTYDNTVDLVVRWTVSATESVVWNMSGTFDAKKKTVRYTDCVKSLQSTDEDGKTVSKTVYQNGKGSFVFTDDGLRWTDKEEHFADDAVFQKV